MNPKPALIFLFILFLSVRSYGQTPPLPADTTEDYDALFSEMDAFFDSLLKPRSYVLFNLGVSNSYFNSTTRANNQIKSSRRLAWSPSLVFFHKSGFGLGGATTIVNNEGRVTPFIGSLTASWDYVKSLKFVSGLSYTRFFTRDSLRFYTSPIDNEVYAYFTYRSLWLRPSVAINYGWGARTTTTEQRRYINLLRLRRRGYAQISTTESVSDLTVTTSLKKDFYWLDLLGKGDMIRLTPQLAFVSGTQRFGFNQTSTTSYGRAGRIPPNNLLYHTENVNLSDQTRFQPLSLAAVLRTEYKRGKFFLQPQLTLDHYFPATEGAWSTFFMVNTGLLF